MMCWCRTLSLNVFYVITSVYKGLTASDIYIMLPCYVPVLVDSILSKLDPILVVFNLVGCVMCERSHLFC